MISRRGTKRESASGDSIVWTPAVPTAFDNSFARLPGHFYSRVEPTPVASPSLIRFNEDLAEEIGVRATDFPLAVLVGNSLPEGADPIALAYAGHQFGGWVPQLGDGRAILLGEVVGPGGQRRDIQLKGSGPTIFSRRGDGRSALGPAIREYVISEAMAALEIPTTRALAVAGTGEKVIRERPLPGAVFTRVASSHIRVGTFQYHQARGDLKALRTLTDHVIARHYPEAAEEEVPGLALLRMVSTRQAELVARWMLVGFIHGVMNTDNCSIAGETIDYGPCAFMDDFHPGKVFSSIDRNGRYAWGKQPEIAHWNLLQLAQCLLPLHPGRKEDARDDFEAALNEFPDLFGRAYERGLARKLGLLDPQPADFDLARDVLTLLAEQEIDFTLFFRRLTTAVASGGEELSGARDLFQCTKGFDQWAARWRERTSGQAPAEQARSMRGANPIFIPRNHRLEEAILAAEQQDFGPFERLLAVLARPFHEQPGNAEYENPPRPREIVHATFCGT